MKKLSAALVMLLPLTLHAAPWGPGTWAFQPGPDPFGQGSLIDLRHLNEAVAGEKGFVRLSKDGNDFVLGDGKPARFWAVGTDLYRKTPAEMKQHARFLAALGVNMIRIHADIAPKDGKAPMHSVDEKELDGIFAMVAAAKAQGIYVTISPFWPHHKIPASWKIEGYEDREGWGLIFFNPKLQAAYKAWIKELYTRKNPYTKIPLARDPAVAIIQILNEDSLLFWTSQAIQKPQEEILRQRYAAWLKAKYRQDPGRVELLKVWDLTQPVSGERAKQAADLTQFYSGLQYDFYRDIAATLRTYGCQQPVNATNWRPADVVLLGDAERWSYTAANVMATNRYVTSVHTGPNDGYRIDPGDHVTDESTLFRPEALPTSLKQVSGHPFIVTESSWVPPMSYQSEGPFLVSAYQSLSGVDAYYWFSATDATWAVDPRFPWVKVAGANPLFKWSCSIPMLMGQFPAAALAYRRGYLKQASEAVHEERSVDDLWQRKVPLISEEGSFDPNRDKGAFAATSPFKQEIDRLAFLVGPVTVMYGGTASRNRTVMLENYIDRVQKKVRSLTGEIELDYGAGLCKVTAPAFQGFSGFIGKAGRLSLPDVSLASSSAYLTAYFVSMDGQPLARSARVLVQTGSRAMMDGWETKPATFKAGEQTLQGQEVVKVGAPPWRIEDTHLSFNLRSSTLKKARVLDVDGRPRQELALKREGAWVGMKLPKDAMYVVLE